MSWIQEIMESTKEMETPRSFWYWSGLATISAVVKDNIWLSRGGAYNLYPNIYVMLLAGSALKKGPPIGLSKSIVRAVNNTRVIAGRSSIQGIMKKLSTAQTEPGKPINTKSTGYVVASEFSSSLVEDPAAFNVLTDLYDRHYNAGEWESLLKSETFNLKDATLSMLVATNDPHLRDFVKEKDIYGGFFGRMFVIKEESVARLNSLVDQLEHPPAPEKFVPYMKEISLLKGPFKNLSTTEPTGRMYNDWYHEFYTKVRQQRVEDPTGTIGRFGDSVLKVAMLLSLSESPNLEISMSAMEEALSVSDKFMEGIKKTTVNVKGKATFADQKALIIAELLSRPDHKISREQLLKKFWMHINSDELDIIMRSFDESKMIRPHTMGNVMFYEMPEEIAKGLVAHFNSRKK